MNVTTTATRGGSSRARAIVVGGGILGVSTLYHLVENGWRDVVLIEKSGLTSGSTWHSSGDLGFAVTDPLHQWFVKQSAQLYQSLDPGTENRAGWKNTGGLRLAYTADDERAFGGYLDIAGRGDVPLEIMSSDRAAGLHPLFDFRGVRCCLFSLRDGHVDPSGVTMLMAEHARKAGAQLIQRDRVAGIERESGCWSVSTDAGHRWIADHVIVACGCYTPQIGRWFGMHLPVYSFLHHYFVTEAITELVNAETALPIVRDEDCGGYVRQEMKGLLIGTSEDRLPKRIWEDGVPWDEESPLFEPDFEAVGHLLAAAASRFPALQRVGIKKAIRGAVTYTPDGRMLLGPLGSEEGLWVAAGASSGVAWGGGIGKCLADLITTGRSTMSIDVLSPRRFDGETQSVLCEQATEFFVNRGKTRATRPTMPSRMPDNAPLS